MYVRMIPAIEQTSAWWERALADHGWMRQIRRGELAALALCLALYLYTRLAYLSDFPIYFFCDEAIHGVLARELVARGFRDHNGVWLPPYFRNAEKWSLSLSVYLHAASLVLFGIDRSVWFTRATSVFAGALAPLAVAALLRFGFQQRSWWIGILALCAMPAWFIHSRTAFETVLMVACYAAFLFAYTMYRLRDDRWIVPTILLGAATFYSYVNGQGVILISGALLLISDWRYHLSRSPARLWAACLTLIIALVPLLRFRWQHPDATVEHLRALQSYWLKPIPLNEKLQTFAGIYVQGLDPRYWFWPNTIDLDRHRFPDQGHIPLWLLPFALGGLICCLWRWREPVYRLPIVAALAAPFSSALVGLAVTRALAMVIPITLLVSIGAQTMIGLVSLRWQRALSLILGAALAISSLVMLRSAVLGGPLWFRNYGLYGMQYGAQQLFVDTIPELIAADPQTMLRVSPAWANNPNSFVDFFLTPAQRRRVELINIDAYLYQRRALDPARDLFIMTGEEYERARQSGKFIVAPPERIIPYPDGQPGFYVTRLEYVANIDELLAADRAARAALVETPVLLAGQPVIVAHSRFDIGSAGDLFDNDPQTLARGFEANPLAIEIRFPEPRTLTEIELTVGTMDFDLTVTLTTNDGQITTLREQYRGLPMDPTVTMRLPQPLIVNKVRLDILQVGVGEVAHVHAREIRLR